MVDRTQIDLERTNAAVYNEIKQFLKLHKIPTGLNGADHTVTQAFIYPAYEHKRISTVMFNVDSKIINLFLLQFSEYR
jgi:hypothetical protein